MKKNKYTYFWVIQAYYSGWEDESFYDKSKTKFSEVRKDFKEYQIAEDAPHRIISRRELNED